MRRRHAIGAMSRSTFAERFRVAVGRSPADYVTEVRIDAAKRLLDTAGRVDLATGFAAEQTEIGALIGSPNQVEAVTAGFEKRAPVFGEARPT